MRLNKLISGLFILLSFAAHADDFTYNCTQRTDRSPVDPKIGAISVSVQSLKNVTKEVSFGNNYDHVYKVKLDVSRTLNKKTTKIKSFEAIATTYDVKFNVWANKEHGVGMYIYLDELDESGITLTDASGKKTEISLDCGEENN